MTDPVDEAESDGEKAQLLPVSAPVKSASLITRELDGCLAPNQHRGKCKARTAGLRESRETRQGWLESGWPDREGN